MVTSFHLQHMVFRSSDKFPPKVVLSNTVSPG